MSFSQKHELPLIGKKFGDWIVIDNTLEKIQNGKHYARGVTVECKHGIRKVLTLTSLYRGKTKGCDRCGAERSSQQRFMGVGDLSSAYFNRTKKNALKREISFDISIQDVWDLYRSQDGRCALTGVEISLNKRYAARDHTQTASLDRIDSNVGYIKNNIQWVDKNINMLKRGVTQEEFIHLCKRVARYQKGQHK